MDRKEALEILELPPAPTPQEIEHRYAIAVKRHRASDDPAVLERITAGADVIQMKLRALPDAFIGACCISWNREALVRMRIRSKPILFSSMSRCLLNFTAHPYRGTQRRGRGREGRSCELERR